MLLRPRQSEFVDRVVVALRQRGMAIVTDRQRIRGKLYIGVTHGKTIELCGL